MAIENIYDLKRLFNIREVLEGLDLNAAPWAVGVETSSTQAKGSIGILSGSFNPPTLAHMELVRRAKESFQLDRVFFTISRITIDKEKVGGLILEDRLLLLSLLAESLGWASVAVVNKGLYFEQARAFRSLLGEGAEIYFIVGMDKVIQIFDPYYYKDMEKALKDLFSETQLIAAGRGTLGKEELKQLLAKTEIRHYRDKVHYLPIPEEMRGLASSDLRNKIADGELFHSQLPDSVERFVMESLAYRPAYEFRSRLLDLLYGVRDWAEAKCDFEALVRIAAEETERGGKLRGILGANKLSPIQLKGVISNWLKSDSKK